MHWSRDKQIGDDPADRPLTSRTGPEDGITAADYAKLLPWWAKVARAAGHGCTWVRRCTRPGTRRSRQPGRKPGELSKHLTFARDYPQVRGHVFFSGKDVKEDKSGAMARVVADHYEDRVNPPR